MLGGEAVVLCGRGGGGVKFVPGRGGGRWRLRWGWGFGVEGVGTERDGTVKRIQRKSIYFSNSSKKRDFFGSVYLTKMCT